MGSVNVCWRLIAYWRVREPSDKIAPAGQPDDWMRRASEDPAVLGLLVRVLLTTWRVHNSAGNVEFHQI